MSDIVAPVRPFAVGDRVEIRRNLDHPAWMDLVTADLRDGGSKWVRKPGLDEVIGQTEITELGRENFQPVARAGNGFWYRQDSGEQKGSGATYIVHVERGA